MEYYNLTQKDSNFYIEGFPDAVKVFRLNDKKSKRLADLALHKIDLEFASGCLKELNSLPPESHILRQALWRCAILHFMKCFGGDLRCQISANKIWKGNAIALLAFNYFKNLRHKHFVHDVNSYTQSLPGAVLNRGNKPFKIEKIVCLNVFGQTLEKDNYGNLSLLVQTALEWVTKEFDELSNIITKDLEAEPYDKLLGRDTITYTVPTIDEIDKPRSIP